jgi:hypothetical protein
VEGERKRMRICHGTVFKDRRGKESSDAGSLWERQGNTFSLEPPEGHNHADTLI